MPYYTVGDYYGRGDYYRGDGLFSSIGKIFKTVVGAVAPSIPIIGPAIATAQLRSAAAAGAVPLPLPALQSGGNIVGLPAPLTKILDTGLANLSAPGAAPPGTAVATVGRPNEQGVVVGPDGKLYSPGGTPLSAAATARLMTTGTHLKKSRRMNWANTRALGRAERRIHSAVKHMTKYIRWVHPTKEGHAAPKFGKRRK